MMITRLCGYEVTGPSSIPLGTLNHHRDFLGGRIDHGHHLTQAKLALEETLEFANAVEAAVFLTDPKDTLIVVTADHAHTMSFAGYPARGHDILGIAGKSDMDGKPYSTLSYSNGEGYKKPKNGERYDITNDNMRK